MIVKKVSPKVWTVAELYKKFGPIPANRIRSDPPPGTATEQDVIDIHDHEDRLYELADGILVEKVMGYFESRLAAVLIYFLEIFLDNHDLGIVAGEAGMMRISAGLVRIPDVSFVSWDRLPGRKIPKEPIPNLVPDLAVEVLSEGNTEEEMKRKLREYFRAGVRLVWYADPKSRTVTVYTAPSKSVVVREDQVLEGGSVLPGFSLSLREWFARAERKQRR